MKYFLTCSFVLLLAGILQSQTVFNAADPVVNYDSFAAPGAAANPSQPAVNVIAKWVCTPKMPWNTSRYKAYIIGNIPFRLRYPDSYQPGVNDGKKYPVMLFFHGGGEANPNIRDNEWQLINGGQTFPDKIFYGGQDAFILFPQSKYVGWDDSYFTAMNIVIDSLVKNCKADEDRVVSMGLSIGGIGSVNYAISYPKRVSTIIANSPVQIGITYPVPAPAVHVPLWMGTGGKDTNPDPGSAQNFVNFYRSSGGDLYWSYYPQQGHNMWDYQWGEEPNYGNRMSTTHKANPLVYFNNRFFCPGTTVSSRLGITAGFYAYQWDKNGVILSGAVSNEYIATDFGTYRARFKRTATADWSAWSLLPAVISPVCPPVTGNGTGLKGTYYNNVDFTSPASVTRVDSAINFIYDFNTSPVSPLGVDHYSIKWTGKIQPQFTETYTFYTKSDDGIRLTIGGVQLINNFADHGTTEDLATMALVAGQKYDIVIDYYNRNGGGTATLKWSGPSTVKQMVPATQLYPDTTGTPAVPLCATNTAPANNAVIGTQTTATLNWNAAATATAYDVYLWSGATAPVTPTAANIAATTFNAAGLTAATVYNWYVVPKNAAGAATGCSTTNKTSFTTAAGSTGTGTGLQGAYYNNITLTGSPVVTRIDTTINFDYVYTAAAPGVNLENYSVSWTGKVKAVNTQTYTFYAVTDDGVRLWVNGVQLINNWVNQGATEKSGSIALVAGQLYDIVMEYYQGTGYASSKLYWSGASTPKAIVPKLQLFPPGAAAAPLCTTTISPANGSTVALATSASLSWNAAANATAYDLYLWTGAAAPATATVADITTTGYIATGLTAASTYNWYVVPKNATGSAAGCSALKTTFVTAAASVPACTANTTPVNGSTVAATNTATLTWVAAATAASYDVYIWTGSTAPVSPTVTTASTSYTVTGLAAATLYNWYVAPKNASGAAAGCSVSNRWTFSTAGAAIGTGLQGAYFNNITLTGTPVVTRVDPTVNFDYIYQQSAPGMNLENYSVRWTGQVKPLFSETYTFYANTDDGVRLWVNGVQLVNNWVNQGATEKSGSISLTGGQRYDIVMEYYQGTGYATAKLSWSSASTAKAIIPASQLYPPGAAARAATNITNTIAAPAFSVAISPNPVTAGSFASLQVASGQTGTAVINIINSNGFVIRQQRMQLLRGINNSLLNINTLKQGLYIINVSGGAQPVTSKLLIK